MGVAWLFLYMRICIRVGGMEVCVIAKLSVSESKREFLSHIF